MVPPHRREQPRAILLTGTVGSGKTTVAVALGELLAERGESYAVVDLDWLAWFRGSPGSTMTPAQMAAANLRAIWSNYEQAGVDRLVLARHVRSAAEAQALREAVNGISFTTVRLEVPRALLEERVRRRDVGTEQAEHLELIAQADQVERFEDASVRGDVGTPREVALAVLRAVSSGR